MKRWIAAPLGILLALSFCLTAHAASDAEITVVDTVPDESEASAQANTPPSAAENGLQPVDIRMETVGGVPYITKIYEQPGDAGFPAFPYGFEQDGFTFSRHEILTRELPKTEETKQAFREATTQRENSDKGKLLEETPREIPFSEQGFTGTLHLEPGSIVFDEGARTSTSYTLSETREYPGLPSNDASYVDKAITKNGATLHLQSIEWEVTATAPTDGGLSPRSTRRWRPMRVQPPAAK